MYRFNKRCAIAQELFKEYFVVLMCMGMDTGKKEEGKHSFIEDVSKLQEGYRIPKDQSGLRRAAKNFRDYLDGVSEKTSMIGYVGPFGTGKSAVLEMLDPREIFLREKKEEKKKEEDKEGKKENEEEKKKEGEDVKREEGTNEGDEKKKGDEEKEGDKEEEKEGDNEESTVDSPPSLRGVSASERADATKQSSFFHKAKEYHKEDNEEWIVFDAWKYPNREKLWESLLLELAGRPKLKRKWQYWLFDKIPRLFWSSSQFEIKASIFGKQKEYQIAFCVGIFLLFGLFFFVPIFFLERFLFLGYYEIFSSFAVRHKEIFQLSLGLLGVFFIFLPSANLADLQKELERILKKRLKNENDTLVLVVEDIDRCDDAGVHFLETMHYFLKEYVEKNETFKGKIRVIVPLDEVRFHKKSDSYFKCLDLVEFALIPTPDIDAFLKSVLIEGEREKSLIIANFFSDFLRTSRLNIRQVKVILRNSHYRFLQVKNLVLDIDWRLIIVIETARFTHMQNGSQEFSISSFSSSGNNMFCSDHFRTFIERYIAELEGTKFSMEDIIEVLFKKEQERVGLNSLEMPPGKIQKYRLIIPQIYQDIALGTFGGGEDEK